MAQPRSKTGFDEPIIDLHMAIYEGNFNMVRVALMNGADINRANRTGLTPLHLAIGTDNLVIARYLVQLKVAFKPDEYGRMPSVLAVDCRVSSEMCDYIVEAEARALGML